MAFPQRADLPDRDPLPWYLAPLPRPLEDLGLRIAWLVVAVNLAAMPFGFWYYGFHPYPLSDPLVVWQFAGEPTVMWPVVPDTPVAAGFIALSLTAWKLDAGPWAEAVHALAFFGGIKLGLWTPYVQLALNGPEGIATWLYLFLIGSHLVMAGEVFLIHRYASFPGWAIAVAVAWYGFNDLVDYFLPLVGGPHHTYLRAELTAAGIDHSLPAHDLAAAAAVALTLLATALAVATRVEKLKAGGAK